MDTEAKERFAETVRTLRGNRNHEQFARVIGVSRPTIIGWEKCRVVPKRESLEAIAELRGETLDEFLSYLNGAKKKDPLDKLLMQITGLTHPQLAIVLQAIAKRLNGD